MKKILIFFVVLVAFLAAFVLLQKPAETESRELPQVAVPQLYEVAEEANMVMIASVGLGKAERRKVLSGRLYRNFVQLLKTNGEMDVQDSFATDCKVGARLEFYRDTVLVGEFRLTNLLGRDGVPGVWKPLQSTGDQFVSTGEKSGFWKRRRMAKIYKFLRDNGIHFGHCDEAAPEHGDGVNVLTMPEFGAARKARKNQERSAASDSVTMAAAESAALPREVAEEARNVMNLLDEMVLPSDTAVGTPLAELFKAWNRGEVTFYDSTGRHVQKTAGLDASQVMELGGLLAKSRYESYGMNDRMLVRDYVKITLFRDSLPEMELREVSGGQYASLLKCPVRNGFCILDGVWFAAEPDAIKNFVERFK